MGMPRISVLMSVFNGEKYLDESIQSILMQSFMDFEFIIINDGSNDKTGDILKNYKKRDQRIVVIDNRYNLGLPKSLNIGIKIARANYIARQDADDLSVPERLEKQWNFMEANKNISILGSCCVVINDTGKARYNFRLPLQDNDIKKWLKSVNCFCHGSIMFRKAHVEEAGLYPFYLACEDYVLWLEMSNNYKFANMPDFLYKLRLHKNATSAIKKHQQWESVLRVKKDKGIITDNNLISGGFISKEFFAWSRFFYSMGMMELAVKNLIKGLYYRIFYAADNINTR